MAYSDVIIADSPIRYYRLEETSGIVAQDQMGNQSGSFENNPTLGVVGVVDKGIWTASVASPSSYLTTPLPQTKILSLEFWCLYKPGKSTILFRDDTTASSSGWFISVSSVIQLRIGGGSTHNTNVPGSLINDDEWHHIVLTSSGTTVILYIDGQKQYQWARVPTDNIQSPLKFGRNNVPDFTEAKYDEIAIYDYVLTDSQVLSHYEAAFTPDPPENLTQSGSTANSVSVSWSPPSSGLEPDGYEYQIDSGTIVFVGDVLTTTVSGLPPASTFVFSIRSTSSAGPSAWTSLIVSTDEGPPTPEPGSGQLTWNDVGARRFELGTDRGVLYPNNSNGIAWNGLLGVNVSSEGGAPEATYQDGIKRYNKVTNEDIIASLSAFTYPREFEECDGTKLTQSGLGVGQQRRLPFSLCWRTMIGNDIDGIDHGYRLHFLYNVIAEPTDKPYSSLSNDPEISSFNWSLNPLPSKLQGYKPTSYFSIDSTAVSPYALEAFENIIYGTEGSLPKLPPLQQVITFFVDFIIFEVYDLGDGVWQVIAPDELAMNLPNDLYQLNYYSVVDNEDEDGTFTMSSG